MNGKNGLFRLLSNDSKGFTLLEVIISMTILALMTSVVFGGLRLSTRAWEKGEREAERLQRIRIVSDLISTQLRCAFPYSLIQRPKQGQERPEDRQEEADRIKKGSPVFFEGKPDALQFVTTRALDPSLIGLAQVFYDLERDQWDASSTRFRERERFVRGINSLRESLDREGNLILEGLASLQFSYYGKASGEKDLTWRREWNGRQMRGLPTGIRIQVAWAQEGILPLDWTVWIAAEPWNVGRVSNLPALLRPFIR